MNKSLFRKFIKHDAQVSMQGNWIRSFVVTAISFLATNALIALLPLRIPSISSLEATATGGDALAVVKLFLPAEITYKTYAFVGVIALLYLFVLAPLRVGEARFYLGTANRTQPRLSTVFSVYTSFKTVASSILLYILTSFLTLFWMLIFSLVPVAFVFCAAFLGSPYMLVFAYYAAIAAGIFGILWTSRYRFAVYILAEGKLGAFKSLRTCLKLLDGHNGECIVLRASYFFWDVISSFIPVLTFPYNALCKTVYAKYLGYMRGEQNFSENVQ